MNSDSCKIVRELLVDYADGQLAESEAERVDEHLATCSGCREAVARLERSLDLAREVWSESAKTVRLPSVTRRAPTQWLTPAAVAASIALVSLTAWWLADRWKDHHPAPVASRPVTPEPDAAAVAEMIEREGRIARLAASAELLASNPALKEYQEQADRYLAEAYGYRRPGG